MFMYRNHKQKSKNIELFIYACYYKSKNIVLFLYRGDIHEQK